MQDLSAYIRARAQTDEASLDFVLSHFRPAQAKRGEILLDFGDVCRQCYFLRKGALQIFYLDKNGDRAIRDFAFEGTFVAQLQSFINQTPSPECFQALEKTELLAISHESFFKLVAQVPQFGEIYRRNLEISYTNSVNRVASFISLDAAGRVRWLLDTQPYLLQRVPNHTIASYLGISPETFSRILSKARKS